MATPINSLFNFNAPLTGGTTTPFNVSTIKTPQSVNPFASMGILGNPTAQTTKTNVMPSVPMGLLAKAPVQNIPKPTNTIPSSFANPPTPTTPTSPTAPVTPTPQTPPTISVASPTGQQDITPSIGGILPSLFQNAYQNPQIAQTQQEIADLKKEAAQQIANIGGSRTNLAEAGGEQGLLQNLYANKLGALNTQLQQQTQEQQIQQEAVGKALGAVAPQAVPYSSQYISPATGQPIAGGTTPGNLQDAASLYASRVLSGGMSYDQATQALSSYGPVGQQELTKLLGSDFSTVQSNVNAAIQGQLGPAAQNAANQLQNLQTTMASSPTLISTGMPFVNAIARTLSSISGVGAGSSQALASAVTDARAAMANALGVANNSTPSTYDEYVRTLLPDGITPDQLSNAITQFMNQIQGKLEAYKVPGTTQYQSNVTNQNATGNLYSW